MKKYLSLILVLMMLAATAVPAVYAESQDESGEGIMLLSGSEPELLPYKLETFKRFRNSVTGNNTNAISYLFSGIAVLPHRFPLFGDSALIGVHDNMGTGFYEGADATNQTVDTMNIGIIGEGTSSTVKPDRALKVKGASATETTPAGIAAVSAGFIPVDVLVNSFGVEFTWQEKAVNAGENAKILLQWVGSDGLAITNNGTIAEIEHNATLTSDSYTDVSLYVKNGYYKYHGGEDNADNGGAEQALDNFVMTNSADIPDDAVGLKIVIGAVGGERYYKQFGVNVASCNMASVAGDLMYFDETATSVTVKFSSPITGGRDDVKLYDGSKTDDKETEEVDETVVTTTPTWNDDYTELTLDAGSAFGINRSFRISTSKADTDSGMIFNDIRFATRYKSDGTNGDYSETPSDIRIYDLHGNEYPATYTITEDDDDEDSAGSIAITLFIPNTWDQNPTAIVPAFDLTTKPNAGVFYSYDTNNTYKNNALLGIRNGATVIPYKNFAIYVGTRSSSSKPIKSYAVTLNKVALPSQVDVAISPAIESETLTELGYDTPVKVTFTHEIADTDCITIEKDGTPLDSSAYTIAWSADASVENAANNTCATISPVGVWEPGAEYQLTVDSNASIFGEYDIDITLPTDGLKFNVVDVAEVAATIDPVDGEENLNALGYIAGVKVSFDYEIADTDCITMKKDGTDLDASAYEIEWAADKMSVVITPATTWVPGGVYQVEVDSNASIFGEYVSITTGSGLDFTVSSDVPEAEIVTAEVVVGSEGHPYTDNFDPVSKAITIVYDENNAIDFSSVTVNLTLGNSASYVKSPSVVYPVGGQITFTLNLSAANSIDNAALIVVDNGLGDEATYKIYCAAYTPPVSTPSVYDEEDFEDATVGSAWVNKTDSFVESAGYSGLNNGVGKWKPSAASIPEGTQGTDGQTAYANIVNDNGNKVLYVTSTNVHAGFVTKEIPKSVYEDSYKVKFSFDMKSVPGDGQLAVGQDGRAWIFGDFDSMRQLNDEHGIFLYEYNGLQYQLNNTASTEVALTKLANAWEANKWYNIEFILEKAYVPDDDPRKIAGTIGDYGTVLQVRMKEKNATTWAEGTKTIILKWNYTEAETLGLLWNRVKGAAYFDNFKFTSYEMDNAPEITLQNGTYISADDGYFDVEFKAPISMEDIENKLYVTDISGNRVDCTYQLSADLVTLRIYPEITESNKVYKVVSDGLLDVTGMVIEVSGDIPVGPVDVLPYSTTTEYDILANDYSQTLNIFYKYPETGAASLTVDFTYGDGVTVTSTPAGINNPTDGRAFGVAKVTVPEDVVANSGGKVKITVNSGVTLNIVGVVFETHFDLDAVNSLATGEPSITATDAILSMVELIGKATDYYYLTDDLKEGLETALINKLTNEGIFADVSSAITWITAVLADAVANNDGSADTTAKIVSAEVTVAGTDRPYEGNFDATNKEISIIYSANDVIDFSSVTVDLNLGNPVTYIKLPQELYPAARETEVSISLNLTSAQSRETAVELVLDNGLGNETTYKVFCTSYIPPAIEESVYDFEDFEDAAAGDTWLDKTDSFIPGAGYSGLNNGVGKWTPSSNEETGYAEVVDENGNKVIYIESGNAFAGFVTKDIPKSEYEDSYKAVFSFDMKTSDADGKLPVGQDGRLWLYGNFDSVKQNNDEHGLFINEYGGFVYSLSSGSLPDIGMPRIFGAWEANKWYNVEFVLEKVLVPDDDPRKIAGTIGDYGTTLQIRMKEKNSSTWTEGYVNGDTRVEKTVILKWNYTEAESLALLWNRVNGAAYFDNFKFTSYSMDIDTSIEYQHGTYIDANDGYFDVKFKSPIGKDGIEDRLFVTDSEGNRVESTYEFSGDFKTIRVYPEIAEGNGNKVYKVKSVGLVDMSDISIVANFDIPVGPTGVLPYNTTTEYDILANDYSQTLNVYYNYPGENKSSLNVTFSYGDGLSATSSYVSIENPTDGTVFGVAKVTIPADAVANSGGKVKVQVNSSSALTIGGVVVEEQFDLEAVNNATEDTVTAVMLTMIKLINGTADFNSLAESAQEDLEDALLDRLEETGDFADKAAVITWTTEVLEDAVDSNPNPDVPVPGDPDDGDDGDDGSDGDGGSFPGPGTTEAPVVSYPQFSDLGQASWATSAINALYLAGIIDGITPTEFAPLQNVTREQFVKLIVVAFDMYNPFAVSSFSDVEKGAWYESYVASAYNAGIINGISASEFGVGQELTREQMASILKRACDKAGIKLDGYNTATFSDSDTISAYAADDVKALVKAGIINGIDGTFSPKLTANRAMAAQVIYLTYTLKK